MAKKDWQIIRLAFMAAIVSIGGWSIFSGITSIIPLETFHPFLRIGFGILMVYLTYKLGWAKEIK